MCAYFFTAIEDLSYLAIAGSTPTRKRRYHGVDYCMSAEDFSKDSKLTKIQQRYLISERASHCSTVSTPHVQKVARELLRKKKKALALAKQTTADEKDSKGASKEEGGVVKGGNSKVEGGVVKDKELIKIKTYETTSLRVNKSLRKWRSPKKRKNVEGSGQSGSGPSHLEKVGEEAAGRSLGEVAATRRNVADQSSDSNSSNQVPMSRTNPVPTSFIPISIQQSEGADGDSSRKKKKEKRLKDMLGQEVVVALKKHGMARNHQHFRTCYERLFNLSKMFMKVSILYVEGFTFFIDCKYRM